MAADYTTGNKEYLRAHPDDTFNPANGFYATYNTNYRDHH